MPAVDGGVVPVADAERLAHDFGLYAVDDVLVCGDFHRPLVGLSYQYGDAGRCRNLFESADFPALGNRFFAGRMLLSAAWVVLQASPCRSAV